jgi:outer membrane protein OmpA-like peptidoglycan-associated protein
MGRSEAEIGMRYSTWTFIGALVLLLSGCYTTPTRPVALDDARIAVDVARADPAVATLAPDELQVAVATYEHAESLLRRDGYTAEVRRLAHLAQERAATAQQMAHLRNEAMTESERARIAAEAREREARSALHAEAHADSARAALAAEAQARIAQERALAAQQRAPSVAPQREPAAVQRRAPLEAELRDLAATKSERGVTVTLNDVLFEPGSARLRPGGQRLVARLAELLREHPARTVAIEGFMDSSGSDAQSEELSEQRAASVRQALMDAGVDGSQVLARGYGKAFPVASNETPEGRQRNRRVEVVISDERGAIAPRVATYGGR